MAVTITVADLRLRVERLESENAVLKSALADLSRRLEQLESERKAELADYQQREAALYEFAKTLPAPPDYGTDDAWEIARRVGQQLGPEEIRRLFDEDCAMTYTVLLIADPDGGYVVRVPALQGCVTEGDGLDEALANAREAILAYVESLEVDGLPVPGDQAVIELHEDEKEAWAIRVAVRGEQAVA